MVAIGSILLPAMIKQGFPARFGAGVITTSGALGILIPPSIVMVMYAVATNTSVGALFLAGQWAAWTQLAAEHVFFHVWAVQPEPVAIALKTKIEGELKRLDKNADGVRQWWCEPVLTNVRFFLDNDGDNRLDWVDGNGAFRGGAIFPGWRLMAVGGVAAVARRGGKSRGTVRTDRGGAEQ